MRKPVFSGSRSLVGNRSGVAAVEMALVAPFLLIIIGGVIDCGLVLYDKTQLVNAVSAGAEYAVSASQGSVASATITSNVAAIVKGQFSFPFAVSAASVTASYLPAGSSGSTTCCLTTTGGTTTCSASTTSCKSDGSDPGIYLQVNASFTFQPLFPTDGFLKRTVSDIVTGRIK